MNLFNDSLTQSLGDKSHLHNDVTCRKVPLLFGSELTVV